MNVWRRQYDLLQLKYLAVQKDLCEVETMLTQPVVQADRETKQRIERLILALKIKIATYRTEMSRAKRMMEE